MAEVLIRRAQQEQLRQGGAFGPSAQLPGGGSIQCRPGQELSVESDGSARCTNPQDVFTPSTPSMMGSFPQMYPTNPSAFPKMYPH